MTHPFLTRLSKHHPNLATIVSRETIEKLEAYIAHLLKWNPKINLICPSTASDVWERHILDSIQLAAYIPTQHRVLDIGSGAGLPGIPLAILGYDVTMIESDTRKSVFIQEAIRICGLGSHARIHPIRIEQLAKTEMFDTISARALAPLSALCTHAYPHMAGNAQCLFPKGQQYRIEMVDARKSWEYVSHEHPSASNSQSVILQLSALRPLAA
jgi:16S rRNA (guanine527-N7)-methyltransferase